MTLRIRKMMYTKLGLIRGVAGTVAMAALFSAPAALALDLPSLPSIGLTGSYYGGAGLGGSQIEPQVGGSGYTVTNSNDGGAQLFLGRDLSARISVEGYYSDLGSASVSNEEAPDGRINYSSAGISGLLYLFGGGGVSSLANRTGLNIYARLGAGRVNNQGLGIQFDRNEEWSWSAGFGAEYHLKNGFGLRSEIHNFDADARVLSFNLVKRFRVKNTGDRIPLILDRDENALKISDKDAAAVKKAKLINKDTDGDGVNDHDDLCDTTKTDDTVDEHGCNFGGVIEGVTFTTGSADMTQQGSTALDEIIVQLQENEEVQISLQAHTDNRGDAGKNMQLSRKRAETVVRYLVDIGKIDLGRMAAIGYGESKPRMSNRTSAGRQSNRRVEIKIVN